MLNLAIILFANKIAFSSQIKQLKRFYSSFTCGDAIYEVLLFLSTHHLIGVGNNVNWSLSSLIIPASSFRTLQKSLLLSLFP